ncbi:unnamed protein product [Toxocara canis]|uniref:Uncharacterized protein n=1 Tax=Toxocara canis TaxID=6265 RepID=A0A3P7HI18_TOXCA|nr:unnamed protein product [Toxocara canis]
MPSTSENIKEYDRRANLWNVLNAQGCGAFSRKVHSVSYGGVVMDIVQLYRVPCEAYVRTGNGCRLLVKRRNWPSVYVVLLHDTASSKRCLLLGCGSIQVGGGVIGRLKEECMANG